MLVVSSSTYTIYNTKDTKTININNIIYEEEYHYYFYFLL